MSRTLALETVKKVGEKVLVQGWVNVKRDHGQVAFVDVRDRSGIVQVVGTKEQFKSLKPEFVVEIVGEVLERTEATKNPNLPTGTVEIKAESIAVLNQAKPLPLPIDTSGLEIDEEVRLKYRYLDMRRPRMANNIRLRSKAAQFIRNWLIDRDFVEIETPILTKTTPEGARDFLVPSRLQPGSFYALPQSPQQYKQLLMVAGFERYFQLARCFRDEDPRADRAYGEFTQLDMELSFATQEDILQLTEELFTTLAETLFPEKYISQKPWPRLSHQEAVEKYGSDKPDLRKDKSDPNELAFAWTIDFPLFTEQSEDDFYHGSGTAKFAPSHHMFTAPHPDDIPLLDSDPLKVRGLQHDMVLNGFEVGGGSIRIHQSEVQAKVFDLIGFSQEQKAQFQHMLTAFSFGVPPHGGIAPGLDRFIYVALGEPSLREVMAFPTQASGRTAVVEAPSKATDEQLAELGIKTIAHDQELSVYERILDMLQRQGVDYEHYAHESVKTSEDAAAVRGDVRLHMGAKALILKADEAHILFVVPADKKADLKALRGHVGAKKIEFAKSEWVEKNIALPFGSIPPFGSLMGLSTYVDKDLEQPEIVFNAGRLDRSVKISYQNYLELEKPSVI